MRRRLVSVFSLLGFAAVALIEAFRGGRIVDAVPRMVLAACMMALVGYLAGLAAEKAIAEAVDAKAPPWAPDDAVSRKDESNSETEGD